MPEPEDRASELGSLSREQAASLAGLAPFDHDSGRHRGERHISGGRARVRTALYTAALPASYRWNLALAPCAHASPHAAKPTNRPSSPAPESFSLTPTPSSKEAPHGFGMSAPHNGCSG
ncbi:IS110 family transposase [Methylobacterium gnaphalii]|uniref:IS110 family transposase n=1 Tax=Methylobacterium gnaphalii TaxID=1010610 RepID=UPI001EE1C4E0|nr:IS110 family transposase [Methylobacterium gnaphalii]